MKTAVIENGKDNATVNSKSTDKSAIRPAVPLKENANQVDPDKEKPKAETAKTDAVKTEVQPKEEIKRLIW